LKKIDYDIDTIIDLQRITKLRKGDSDSIEYLLGEVYKNRKYIADSAIKKLKILSPMDSMLTRFEKTEMMKSSQCSSIPDWIINSTAGWGEAGDFCDQAINIIKENAFDDKKLSFLEKLVLFPGAYTRMKELLKRNNLLEDLEIFEQKINKHLEYQFPKQINISPTMNCNMHCEYCISGSNLPLIENEMPWENFEEIIDWIIKNKIKRIGITGGEPTQYSHFEKMLESLVSNKFEFYFATNGIFNEEKLQNILKADPLAITMHITEEARTSNLLNTYINNASKLIAAGKNAILRCNIASKDDDPEEFVKIALRCGIKEIRVAVIIPNMSQTNRFIDINFLQEYTRLMDKLVDAARKSDLSIYLAKPLPVCLLTERTADYFLENGSFSVSCPLHYNHFTNNTIVYPDLSYASCLGLDKRFSGKIIDHDDFHLTAEQYVENIRNYTKTPLLQRCKTCPLFSEGRCIGACLSYRTLEDS